MEKVENLKYVYFVLQNKSNQSVNEREKRNIEGVLRRFEMDTLISFNSFYIFNLLHEERYRLAIDYIWSFIEKSDERYFQHKDLRQFFCSLVLAYYKKCSQDDGNQEEEEEEEELTSSLEEYNYRFHLYSLLIKYCHEEVNEIDIYNSLKSSMGLDKTSNKVDKSTPFIPPKIRINTKSPPKRKQSDESNRKKKKKKKKNDVLDQFQRIRIYFPPRISSHNVSPFIFVKTLQKMKHGVRVRDDENQSFFGSAVFQKSMMMFKVEEEARRINNTIYRTNQQQPAHHPRSQQLTPVRPPPLQMIQKSPKQQLSQTKRTVTKVKKKSSSTTTKSAAPKVPTISSFLKTPTSTTSVQKKKIKKIVKKKKKIRTTNRRSTSSTTSTPTTNRRRNRSDVHPHHHHHHHYQRQHPPPSRRRTPPPPMIHRSPHYYPSTSSMPSAAPVPFLPPPRGGSGDSTPFPPLSKRSEDNLSLTIDKSICGYIGERVVVPKSVIVNYTTNKRMKRDIICKFFFDGHCMKGNSCDFVHITREHLEYYDDRRRR